MPPVRVMRPRSSRFAYDDPYARPEKMDVPVPDVDHGDDVMTGRAELDGYTRVSRRRPGGQPGDMVPVEDYDEMKGWYGPPDS